MSSFAQKESVREQLSAAEETFRLCEGTIVQNENEELRRQNSMLGIIWNPQIQPHLLVLLVPSVVPQQWVNAEESICNQQRNFTVQQNNTEFTQTKEKLKEPELLQIKKGQEEQEPPQIKKEQEELYISQDEDQFDLKQEMIEIPTFKGNKHSKAGLSFNTTNIHDEEGSQSPNKHRLSSGESSGIDSNLSVYTKTEPDDGLSGIHKRGYSRKKPVYCKECNKCFSYACFLKIHMRTHTGEKPFLCTECDGRYSKAFALKIHMRAHTGEKPFSCKKCDKGFYRKAYLEAHMRTHTGEKPFFCEKCDKRFNQTSNLRRHMRTHTDKILDKNLNVELKENSNLKT